MIRLIQRRLIIPRGDTGTFSVPVLSSYNSGDVAVFSIINPITQSKVYEKIVEVTESVITIKFEHGDTVNLPVGKYLWDIKFYQNPVIVDGELVNGTEIDSYYAAFTMPVCEIRQTGDNLMTADDAPGSTLTPQQLNAINAALLALKDAVEKTETNVEHYPTIIDDVWNVWDANLGDYTSTGIEATGNGIASIEKTNTEGLVDTYTVNFTDGTTFIYNVTNGSSIGSITKQGTSGLVDTYVIAYTNGDSTTFTVTNGATPDISIGEVREGPIAAASITGTAANPVLNLTLPNANVPTKVSELENDSGYLTQETDPTVPAWAKEPTKPSYTPQEVGALPADTYIPQKTSDLTNDSNYAVDANYVHTDNNYTDEEKEKLANVAAGAQVNVNADWNATSGDAQILNKPTNVSEFTNDAGYLTEHQDISGKADKSEIPTQVSQLENDSGYLTSFTETDPTVPAWAKEPNKPAYTAAEVGAPTVAEMNTAIGEAIGQINSFDIAVVQALPTQDISTHSIYLVPKTGETNDVYDEYIYINSKWEMVGNTQIDLSDYALKSELPTKVSDLTDDSGHYTKPATGIPASDLADGVIPDVPVQDVQVNGTSILSNGVANVPAANPSTGAPGVISVISYESGLRVADNGRLGVVTADPSIIKAGTNSLRSLVPSRQHQSTFYGLAKAAGVDMKDSSNAVGTYTPEAKGAIQQMLGVSDLIATGENDLVASKAYAIGDIFTANGKLYKATAAIAADGAIIVDGANANCEETYISEDLSDKVAKSEIDYAGISKYTYSAKFGGEFSVTTATTNGWLNPYARASVTGRINKENTHRVTFNGAKYVLRTRLWYSTNNDGFKIYEYLGNLGLYLENISGVPGGTDNVPFVIISDLDDKSSIDVITKTAGTYTILVEQIDLIKKDLPKSLIWENSYVPIEKNNNSGTYNGFSLGVNELNNKRATFAIGYANKIDDEFNIAIGNKNTISGKQSVVIGFGNTNTGHLSIIAGYQNNNAEFYSFIEGINHFNFSAYSHIEGRSNYIGEDSRMSHAEGYYNTIRKNSSLSHIEGSENVVDECILAHVEGYNNIASGDNTHVQGMYNVSDTKYPVWTANTNYKVGDKIIDTEYDEGYVCIEENSDSEFDENKWVYTGQTTDGAFIIGNGVEDNRSNALKVTWDGDIRANGDVYVKCNNDSTGGVKLATENIIAIQDTQPTDSDTKIWLPETAETPVQVPTVAEMESALAGKVGDVQVNGVSVVTNGVANVPVASENNVGVLRFASNEQYGIWHKNAPEEDVLRIAAASASVVKAGSSSYMPIVPARQHESVFYGLAKAAGDTTQAASSNAVGTYTDEAKTAIRTMLGAVGTEDYATNNGPAGLVKIAGDGLVISSQGGGRLMVSAANASQVKAGASAYYPVVPSVQHQATFYGLAKAAGDTTQSASSNAVGVYTDNAKASIKSMLGIVDGSTGTVDITGATPTINAVENTRYVCGEVTSLSFTPPSSGISIVRFTSGSTVTVLTLPSTVKFPEWFDPTSLETNTIYEICVTDGVYGAVMSWAL